MPQPEPYDTPPSGDKKSSVEVGHAEPAPHPSSVTEVARTLAAHGGGTASYDLALDLVLNEVVEQARLATGATGAAIALARGGEMVCRATTGGDAPELGVRLETTSGLSAACLQTGKIQQCADTETDPRVNAEACRRLGVRSILILPLGDGSNPFGVFEVFSSRANAFGERDVNTLWVLARRVVESKRGAEEPTVFPMNPNSGMPANQPSTLPREEQFRETGNAETPMGQRSPRKNEIVTSILGVLVIVVAVLLGLLLGWRGAIVRGVRERSQEGSSSAARGDHSAIAAEQKTVAAPVAGIPPIAASASASQPRASTAPTLGDPPTGGLVVSQNGKVIYRSVPAAASGAHTAESSGDVSGNRLIHRVEPEYPADARTQHIQGVVALDVQIGGDGTVHNIAVVEGHPLLAEAAVQAVRQWRYRSYSVDGQPVEMQTRITIRFTLPTMQ
jgi:TonB family protein